MNTPVKTSQKFDTKALVKTGFRRGLGLLILFLTVTASSCTELLSPLAKFFS